MWCFCLCSAVFSVFGGSFSRWKPVKAKAFLFCFSAAATYVLPRDGSVLVLFLFFLDTISLVLDCVVANFKKRTNFVG
jgi:hypothetical protein